MTSAVVTSSPYKNMMEDVIVAMATTSAIVRPPEKKNAKPFHTLPSRKLKKNKTSKKKRCGVKRPCEDSSEDDDEWPCLVCGEPFRRRRVAKPCLRRAVQKQQVRRKLDPVSDLSPLVAS